jgi:hypothetical protein
MPMNILFKTGKEHNLLFFAFCRHFQHMCLNKQKKDWDQIDAPAGACVKFSRAYA